MSVLRLISDLDERELSFEPPERLSELLASQGVDQAHPCGGSARCLKCRVSISGSVSVPSEVEQRAACRLSCQVELLGDATCLISFQRSSMSIEAKLDERYRVSMPFASEYGAAIDLGTSTMVLALCRISDGSVLAVKGCENPQRNLSADVVGRMEAAMRGKDGLLRDSVLTALESLLLDACADAGIEAFKVDFLVVTGNTSMLYLLVGQDVSCLSRAPFTADRLFDEELEILGRRAYIPPCFSAFVGADLACALLSAGFTQSDSAALLCDLGTNGEVALWNEGVLYVASTAAGPCFEGVGLSCGCPSVPGAIDSVWVEDEAFRFSTIEGAPPVGICGSGVIEACSALFERGVLSISGRLASKEIEISKGLYVTQADVRSVQLAKAAIAAGIDSLLNAAGISQNEISCVALCGGLGSSLNMDRASVIGLMPSSFVSKTKVLGNAALEGALMLLLDSEMRGIIDKMYSCATCVPLAGDEYFAERFVEHMAFGQVDEED